MRYRFKTARLTTYTCSSIYTNTILCTATMMYKVIYFWIHRHLIVFFYIISNQQWHLPKQSSLFWGSIMDILKRGSLWVQAQKCTYLWALKILLNKASPILFFITDLSPTRVMKNWFWKPSELYKQTQLR